MRGNRRVEFSGFSLGKSGKGALAAREHRNCACVDGVLRAGVGLVDLGLDLEVGAEPVGAYPIALHGAGGGEDTSVTVVWGRNGSLYRVDPQTGAATGLVEPGAWVNHGSIQDENRRTFHLFCGPMRAVVLSDEGCETVASGEIKGGFASGSRFFIGMASRRLLYSAPALPTQFAGGSQEGGELRLPPEYGEIVGLSGNMEYLYIFLQRGIFRLRAGADIFDFKLEEVAYGGGEICPQSMVATGEGVLFLSESGAYLATGKECKAICTYLDIAPTVGVCATGRAGGLALVEYVERGTGERRRVALSAGGENGYFVETVGSLCGNEICVIDRCAYAFVEEGEDASFLSAPYFESEGVDLGKSGWKALQSVELRGSGEVELQIAVNGISHSYPVRFVDGRARVRVVGKGAIFVFRLLPTLHARVRSLAVRFSCER